MVRKQLAGLVVLTLAIGCAPSADQPDDADSDLAVSPFASGQGPVVHLFEWRWEDVAQECESFLGPTGYTAVQVSPPSENHVVPGRPWWERYQPVSYQLETRSGTREEFADMVSRCRDAGVDVIVDAVINHMTDADLEHEQYAFTARGTAGTEFQSYSYPGLYGFDDFHHCGLSDNDDIVDWSDQTQLEECELVDLADLATEKENVRERLAAYLADLASLGVAGLRVDAALHMAAEDVEAILSEADWDGYVVQEVSQVGEAPRYFPTGAVTDFVYGATLSRGIREGSLSELVTNQFWQTSGLPAEASLVFVDNHDTQRHGEGILNYREPGYALAVTFMLAMPHGRPRVMSSFAFEDTAAGPPASESSEILPVHGDAGLGCGDAWVCEHRWPAIAGMVGFHRATAGQSIARLQDGGADRVAFTRGDRGWVAFNRSDEPWAIVHQTGLPGTSYCNVADGPTIDGECAGGRVRVDAGMVSAVVPPMGLVAVHVEAVPAS